MATVLQNIRNSGRPGDSAAKLHRKGECQFRRTRRSKNAIHLCLMLTVVASLSFMSTPVRSAPGKLKKQTLAAWDEYIHWVSFRSEMRAKQSPFLWISEVPPRQAEVHAGHIAVWRQATDQSTKVPYGLIHDWMGAVFVPKATISEVLAVTRSYDHYAQIYAPAVVAARELSSLGPDDRFSMTLMHKALFVTAAVKGEYEAQYVQVDTDHWYSIARSTRLEAIQNFGQLDMRVLPEDQGPGYIWRLCNFARFEQSRDGVYIEMEALGLSRDVPFLLRWLIDPFIEQLARNSIYATLEETRKAVLLKFSSRGGKSGRLFADIHDGE